MKQTSNIDVKRLNRNKVFRYINQYGRISKPDLVRALGMSSPTVLFLTKELIEKGVIREEGEFESTGGRKARGLSPIHNAYFALGMDITKNHACIVLTDLSGLVIKYTRIKKKFEPTIQYREEIFEWLLDFRKETNIPDEKLLGLGISLPGIINMESNVILYSHVLDIFNVPCEEFSRDIPFPVAFTNDANAAALAELHNHQNIAYALYISLSNSVGGALVFRKDQYLSKTREMDAWQRNNILMGDNYKAGEIGHITLIPDGEECYCGKRGCFDAYCSAKVLNKYTDGKLESFFEGLRSGDSFFKGEWDKYLDYLSIQINNLHILLDCKIIIGGYVGAFIEPYLEDLRARLVERDTFGGNGDYVSACAYRFEASALGAALLHIESYINTI